MKKIQLITLFCLLASTFTYGQFHTVKIPQPSPKVSESQRLGITDITIDYSSPATRERDVWNTIVENSDDPNLAWRAGANMNTRITFSTDVTIDGKPLKAGTYGFHIDAKDDAYHLMFAHYNNQWGSYYLDREKHVSLTVPVKATSCPFSEQLDYEFIDRTDSTVVIALEWAEKRIPFTVEVDLNKTVLENFRHELLGENTYRWEAWNDAARWCLRRNTNLEEALEWANRSINGGYGGFAGNRNVNNMTTKARLLQQLERIDELEQTLVSISQMDLNAYEVNDFTRFLLTINKASLSKDLLESSVKKYPDAWWLKLNKAISYYFLDNKGKALKELKASLETTPESYQARVNEIIKEVEAGTYTLPR